MATYPWLMLLRLLALIACTDICGAATSRLEARFFSPEEEHQLKPVVLQLEALGITQFQATDGKDVWGKLLTDSDEFDLVWSTTKSPPFAQLELPRQFNAKINHLPGAEHLTSPDALAQHFALQQKKHTKFFFDFVPAHFKLPSDQELLISAFTSVRKKSDFSPKRARDPYIYKRFLLRESATSRDGELKQRSEVFVTHSDMQLKLQSTAFKGKTVVVDQYIEPLLLDNHKFLVSFYVAVTSIDPLRVYVYDHALIQIAKGEYPSVLKIETDPSVYNFDQYIAPWDFPDLQSDFHEFPSATREGTNAWRIVKKYLRKQGVDTKVLQDEVDAAIAKTVLSSRGKFQSEIAKIKRAGGVGSASDLSDNFFELWKFDFEFDDMAKPWLVRVVSNPSLEGTQSVLGSDEAVKKHLMHDLFLLVGVHPQARLPFEKFYRSAPASFCSDKCHDKNRAWDTLCWSCPGWFAPHVARKLFAATTEYARRGSFNLVFPSLEQDFSKFLDTELSEFDIAFDRYLKSLSSGYANMEDFPVSDRVVVCAYREHCSNHGDCVNAECVCDNEYEGRTCYIRKDLQHEEQMQIESGGTGGQNAETWKEKVESIMWNRGDAHEDLNQTLNRTSNTSGIVFILVLLCGLLFVLYRVFVAHNNGTSTDRHDGKAM